MKSKLKRINKESNVRFLYWACVEGLSNSGRDMWPASESREMHTGKSPLGRPRHRWEDNIKIEVSCLCWEGWIGFSWMRISGGIL
jgi:hypothetical protein